METDRPLQVAKRESSCENEQSDIEFDDPSKISSNFVSYFQM